jgi:hypothetical protein
MNAPAAFHTLYSRISMGNARAANTNRSRGGFNACQARHDSLSPSFLFRFRAQPHIFVITASPTACPIARCKLQNRRAIRVAPLPVKRRNDVPNQAEPTARVVTSHFYHNVPKELRFWRAGVGACYIHCNVISHHVCFTRCRVSHANEHMCNQSISCCCTTQYAPVLCSTDGTTNIS